MKYNILAHVLISFWVISYGDTDKQSSLAENGLKMIGADGIATRRICHCLHILCKLLMIKTREEFCFQYWSLLNVKSSN